MQSPFHAGEIEVQTKAKVRAMASRVGNGIHSQISRDYHEFLQVQRMVFLGASDLNGRVWATVLTGEPGFASGVDSKTAQVTAKILPGDPFQGAFVTGDTPIGLLAIELATRHRIRINGIANRRGDQILIRTQQVYGNCPKYIQARETRLTERASKPEVVAGDALSEAQLHWIARSDTFFIASVAGNSADISHRGGAAGFVHVNNALSLTFPDYSGNMMFNTLGNIAADGRAGLLFIDFVTGSTLQLSGKASINWNKNATIDYPGAERLIEFEIDRVVETTNAVLMTFKYISPSPFNPKI